MDINLQSYNIDSNIYEICRELQPLSKTNYILQSYKYDYSSMLSCGKVPFLFRNGKIIWNTDLKSVTVGDILNTFFFNDSKDCILNIESDFCKTGDIDFEIKTSRKEFYKLWKDIVKKWGGLHIKIKNKRHFHKFIEREMVSPMSIIQAIYLRNSYTIGEFAFEFSCEKRQAMSVMKCLGYKNINNGREYSVNIEFQHEVETICDNVNGIIRFYKDNQHISSFKFFLRDIYKNIANFFERKKDNIALEIDCTAERVEPAQGERFDWAGFLSRILFLICIVVFAVSVLNMFQQLNTPDVSQYESLSTLIVTVISAVIAFVIERWTITQNFKIDYHDERLKVMPVFSVRCYEKDEFNEYKNEYRKHNHRDLIIENQQGHKLPMYAVYENIGTGIAFQTYIYSCSANPEPIEGNTMAVQDAVIVEFGKGCFNDMYISFRDLYGNLYQQYIKININEVNEKIEVIEQPPELIMRTKRARYIQ